MNENIGDEYGYVLGFYKIGGDAGGNERLVIINPPYSTKEEAIQNSAEGVYVFALVNIHDLKKEIED